MSLNRRITGLVVAAAMLAGGSAVFAQTSTEPGTQTDQQQGMMPGQNMDGMRSMMHEMMQDMMREQGMGPPGAEDDDEEAEDRRGVRRRGGGRGPMAGGLGGYGGGRGMGPDFAHGPGLRITMALMDTDGDGGVSLEEVQSFHARVFKLVDADADGKLTHEEVRSFFRSSSE